MSETPPPSVKAPKPPVIGCQVTVEFRDLVDHARDLFPDAMNPSGRTSRSGVMRVLMAQALPMLDRGNILAVRALAKRLGCDDVGAWSKVIASGLAANESPAPPKRRSTP